MYHVIRLSQLKMFSDSRLINAINLTRRPYYKKTEKKGTYRVKVKQFVISTLLNVHNECTQKYVVPLFHIFFTFFPREDDNLTFVVSRNE